MGTPAFAISPLQQILESEHKVVAVITAPDRKSGRGKKVDPLPNQSLLRRKRFARFTTPQFERPGFDHATP
jgi:methionyl-tRNA formyltransferase